MLKNLVGQLLDSRNFSFNITQLVPTILDKQSFVIGESNSTYMVSNGSCSTCQLNSSTVNIFSTFYCYIRYSCWKDVSRLTFIYVILPILILLVSATCIPCLIYQAIKRRIREVQERHRKEDDKKKEENSESNGH